MLTKSANQPELRDPELDEQELGPGLYPGEVVVAIDGHDVAVSVSSRWLEESGTYSLKAWARAIGADGRTRTGPRDQELERDFLFNALPALVAVHGIEPLSVEMMNIVLGEPPTMVDVQVGEGEAPVQAPMIMVAEDVRDSVSIRGVLGMIGDTDDAPDAAALLGL